MSAAVLEMPTGAAPGVPGPRSGSGSPSGSLDRAISALLAGTSDACLVCGGPARHEHDDRVGCADCGSVLAVTPPPVAQLALV